MNNDKEKKIVLIVDDDPGIRRNLEKTLNRAGYVVKAAKDCIEAVEIFQEGLVHLAILDLRMPNLEGNFTDRAGIDLLEWIRLHHPETFAIMLTGAKTIQTAIEALQRGAAAYLEKDQLRPQNLIPIAQKAILINDKLQIHFGRATELTKNEDEEILRRLFVDSSEIKVSLIAKGTRGTAVYSVTSRDLNGKWRIPFATKITWKDEIIKEIDNYHKWVEHRLSGGRYAKIIGQPAYTFRRGGLNMEFLNTDLGGLREFNTYFHEQDVKSVLKAITNLFQNTLLYWYGSKEFEPLLLVKEYSDYLAVDNWNLPQYINRYLKEYADKERIELPDLGIAFNNPINDLKRLLTSPHDYEIRTYISTTHGDLHASNILVDEYKQCWLIDFTNTGQSHILRDFVELESAIKFNVVRSNDLRELIQLETALSSQMDFLSKPSFSHPNEEIQKAFDVIQVIREYAYMAVAPNNDIREYNIGLLLYSVNMIRFFKSAVSQEKKVCILYSATRLLESLKRS